jgi:NAD(P)-dependent dehydrogenase (short-subunit alcohol dehydrogenase family)
LRRVAHLGHVLTAAEGLGEDCMLDISGRPPARNPAAVDVHRANPSVRLATPRVVLITGCSSGIGYHCAHALRQRGWRVFAACRQQADCERLEREGLETVQLDYADEDSIAAAVEHVFAQTGGRIDALFNNGAYAHPGAVEDLSTDHLRALLETNFIGWYDLTRRIIPAMRKQGSGRIVNCSSVLGFVAVRFTSAYTASKFAVEGWSDALRLELRGSGIHVSLLQPGPIRSRMLENARARFIDTIDIRNSPFRTDYGRELSRLSGSSKRSAFKLGPEAMITPLIHALESPAPRARYRVTIPTLVGAWLKRLLPTGMMDRVLLRQR